MTNEERLRALIGNLKNYDWSVLSQFRIEKEDAQALIDYFKTQPVTKGLFAKDECQG